MSRSAAKRQNFSLGINNTILFEFVGLNSKFRFLEFNQIVSFDKVFRAVNIENWCLCCGDVRRVFLWQRCVLAGQLYIVKFSYSLMSTVHSADKLLYDQFGCVRRRSCQFRFVFGLSFQFIAALISTSLKSRRLIHCGDYLFFTKLRKMHRSSQALLAFDFECAGFTRLSKVTILGQSD